MCVPVLLIEADMPSPHRGAEDRESEPTPDISRTWYLRSPPPSLQTHPLTLTQRPLYIYTSGTGVNAKHGPTLVVALEFATLLPEV
jgi:hypothetical protein